MSTQRPYFYGLGKRKNAIARVRMFQDGEGKVTVNGGTMKAYFVGIGIENALAPLAITDQMKKVDLEVFVEGGGKVAQSDAMRLGISRALVLMDPAYRASLKTEGFLRRDSRKKERKKPGLHGARRAPQFAKR
ncbi:MAG: 30S ribosomal protein S9 [Candidatus Peribacteraceae bacterium]|nr:30S ribosomal protein S9 [Candidatus Peribacteraceae bacterium]